MCFVDIFSKSYIVSIKAPHSIEHRFVQSAIANWKKSKKSCSVMWRGVIVTKRLLYKSIYISVKWSRYISKQTPETRFIIAIFLKYELLFASTHGIFYKQRHQIWPLHKQISKWLHLWSASVPNLDTCWYLNNVNGKVCEFS